MNFTVGPSASYLLMLAAVHLAAIASICYARLPFPVQIAISLLLLTNLTYLIYLDMRGNAWRSFSLRDRSLQVPAAGGKILHGELSPQTLVTPLCVVLCARLDGSLRRRVIFFDAMPSDDFRTLRVMLRYA